MGLNNPTTIQERVVIRADTAPSNQDALWLDTNFDPAELKAYNVTGGTWDSVTPTATQSTTYDGGVFVGITQSLSNAQTKSWNADSWIDGVFVDNTNIGGSTFTPIEIRVKDDNGNTIQTNFGTTDVWYNFGDKYAATIDVKNTSGGGYSFRLDYSRVTLPAHTHDI